MQAEHLTEYMGTVLQIRLLNAFIVIHRAICTRSFPYDKKNPHLGGSILGKGKRTLPHTREACQYPKVCILHISLIKRLYGTEAAQIGV